MSGVCRALLLDYGGVLTGPVTSSFEAVERTVGIPVGRSFEVLVEASRTAGGGLIGQLERGEIAIEDFDATLTDLLRDEGLNVEVGQLLNGLFEALRPAGKLWEVVKQVREAGLATGLLSNSWGPDTYPRQMLDEHFDAIVISGEVGLRKPEPAIYHLACERLGAVPEQCAFVDDLERNVQVARGLGMFGVLHDGDDHATAARLSEFLEVDLVVP